MDNKQRGLVELLNDNERNANWLAKKLNVSHTLVYNWTKGLTPIKPRYLQRICDIFKIEQSWFV